MKRRKKSQKKSQKKRRRLGRLPSSNYVARISHAEFLLNTLGPDLRESGRDAMAEDIERCGKLLIRGKRDPQYARWLRTTLIPDLQRSRSLLAEDFQHCLKWID
jgi:hypothetical protein